MDHFRARLVPGRKVPYDTWTFIEVPTEVERAWPSGSLPVRGTLAGAPFRGTASRGEGVRRVPVTREVLAAAGVARGDEVDVALEPDPEPRPVEVPEELAAVLVGELAALYADLPPSCRRAWAEYVGGARRAETRLRRAEAARAGIRTRGWPGGS